MPHSHTCYFHEPNKITHFCTRLECTLPMCEKCLPIHLQEHAPTDNKEYIITFNEAEQKAVHGLKNMIIINNSIKAEYTIKMQQIKSRMSQLVENIFGQARGIIDGELADVSEIQKKLNKIQKGSLKTLIYYYTEQHKNVNKVLLDQRLAFLQRMQKSFSHLIQSERSVEFHKNRAVSIASFNEVENVDLQHKSENLRMIISERSGQNSKSSQNLLQVQNNNQLAREFDRQYGDNIQLTKQYQKQTQFVQGRERGYSFNVSHTLAAKTQNVRSSSQIKNQHVNYIGKAQQILSSNNHIHHDSNRKLKTDSSYKTLNKCLTPKEDLNVNVTSVNKTVKTFEQNQTKQQYNVLTKEYTQEERQREIQNIRLREEHKQIQRQREKQREIERQRQRQRERQRQKQKQKQRELEKQRFELERESQGLKQRQQSNRQTDVFRTTQDLGLQSTKERYPSTPYQQLLQIERNQGRAFEHSTRKQSFSSNIYRNQTELQVQKKPLQVSDLNFQTRQLPYSRSPLQYKGQYKGMQTKVAVTTGQNMYSMTKQVLSPDEIRKMLQKRIEERSKLISKNKSVTQIRNTEFSTSKSYNKSKELGHNNSNNNNQNQNTYVGEGEGRWDTKDSIINQIYQDYR